MSTETEVAQDLPEGEAVAETPATETAPETGTEQPAEQEEEAPKPKQVPWFQRRFDQLTHEKYEAIRRAEAAEALADRLSKGEPAKADTPQDVDRLVEQKAAELAQQREFNAKCDTIYSSGSSEFGQEWDSTLANFGMLGGLNQPFLDVITQLPDAHKVLHQLGSDMDAAARIMSLPPAQMGFELAKLTSKPVKTAPISKAPPPIAPLDGTGSPGGGEPDPSNVAAWIKWREEKRG